MEINTETDVDRLVETGLDGYRIDTLVQTGGNQHQQQQITHVPLFLMHSQVLKTLNLFKDIRDARINTLNKYFCFGIGLATDDTQKTYSLYLLHQAIPHETDIESLPKLGTPDYFTHIATIQVNHSTPLSELLETVLNMVQSGHTDSLLSLLSLNRPDTISPEQLVSVFTNENTPSFEQTDIEEFSVSLSTIKQVLNVVNRPLLPSVSTSSSTTPSGQKQQQSWLVSNMERRLAKTMGGLEKIPKKIQNEFKDDAWRIRTNRGGGDCFFLSLCQSRLTVHDTETGEIIYEPNGSRDHDTCVQTLRTFIAENITQEVFNNLNARIQAQQGLKIPDQPTPPIDVLKTIDTYKDYIKSSSYFADETTIQILYDNTNLFPVIIKQILTNYTPDKKIIHLFMSNDTDQYRQIKHKQFVLFNHIDEGGGHYELIQFKPPGQDTQWKGCFGSFDELPHSIQQLLRDDNIINRSSSS